MDNKDLSLTQKFDPSLISQKKSTDTVLLEAKQAMLEKGYNPVSQVVGYILSGDPTYITSYKGARSLVSKIERNELLEKIVESYLDSL